MTDGDDPERARERFEFLVANDVLLDRMLFFGTNWHFDAVREEMDEETEGVTEGERTSGWGAWIGSTRLGPDFCAHSGCVIADANLSAFDHERGITLDKNVLCSLFPPFSSRVHNRR